MLVMFSMLHEIYIFNLTFLWPQRSRLSSYLCSKMVVVIKLSLTCKTVKEPSFLSLTSLIHVFLNFFSTLYCFLLHFFSSHPPLHFLCLLTFLPPSGPLTFSLHYPFSSTYSLVPFPINSLCL
jgi:hypothetical protein